MASAFTEQFDSLVKLFTARKVSVMLDEVWLIDLTVMEKYVLSTSISLGRCSETVNMGTDLYRMTWEKKIILSESTLDTLLTGLDNYVCDTGSIIHSVQEGEYDGELLVDFNLLMQMNETARVLCTSLSDAQDKMMQ